MDLRKPLAKITLATILLAPLAGAGCISDYNSYEDELKEKEEKNDVYNLPEPSTINLMALGGSAALAYYLLKRRRKKYS